MAIPAAQACSSTHRSWSPAGTVFDKGKLLDRPTDITPAEPADDAWSDQGGESSAANVPSGQGD